MSAIEQITTLLETMSFAEKLTLNQHIATALRKEGGKVSPKKRTAKEEGSEKPKRNASPGVLAWNAYKKHLKDTQPEAFAGINLEKDKNKVAKSIRTSETEAYDTFVSEWKANYASNQSDEVAEEVVVVAAPVEVKASADLTPKQKIDTIKAAKAAAALAASPAAPTPAKQVKKAVKAPASAKPKAKEEDVKQLPLLTLEDIVYWHEPETQGLWRKETDHFCGENWTGYYQPGNDEEPIRYTDSYGTE